MSAKKLYLYWAMVLVCAGQLWAAPTPSGHDVRSEPQPVSALSDGSSRWSRGPGAARSWRDRTPAVYRDRVSQTSAVGHKGSVAQRDGGHSGIRGSSRADSEADIKTKPRAKAFVPGVRVAADKWRDGYTGWKSQNTEHGRIRGASRKPEKPARTPSSPKLSYIQRRRPFGAAAMAGMFGSKGTRSTARPAATPGQPVLPSVQRPEATSRPRPAATSTTRPARPPAVHPLRGAGGSLFKGNPLLTRRPTEHADLENDRSPAKDSKDRLKVINAAGLVPGTVINKRVSVGLSVPNHGNRPGSRVTTTHRPKQTAIETIGRDRFYTNIFHGRIPHTTRSPPLLPGKTGTAEVTGPTTPPVEVLSLYEIGVLPNATAFFKHQKSRGPPQTGDDHTRGVSGGGGSKDSTKVTFPLYVLPALPGAPPPPDWPAVRPGPVRPCCKGRPGLVVPVDPPDRPVYPSIGSGYKPPLPRPSVPTSRPVSPPSTSYGPPKRPSGLTPTSGSTAPSRPTPPSGLIPPSAPTGRPCGTKHCVLIPPLPSAPPPTSPPAPPPTASATSLGDVGNDLVCVYLRSNGSALVLRADLDSGQYNISDDQNHLLSSPGWLGFNQPQVRDRPNHHHQYDIVYIDNHTTTTVQQLLSRMRNQTKRWEETHRPKTSIVCIVQRPETTSSNETGETPDGTFKPTALPTPSEEPVSPSANPTSPSKPSSTSQPTTTTTPKPTILGAVDSLSSTIASAVDTLGATAEAQLATTMSAADQTAVVIGSNVKNYIGTSIPGITLATTVGIPVFVAMLALLGAPPLLLSALSVSSPLLLQGMAAFYHSLPN